MISAVPPPLPLPSPSWRQLRRAWAIVVHWRRALVRDVSNLEATLRLEERAVILKRLHAQLNTATTAFVAQVDPFPRSLRQRCYARLFGDLNWDCEFQKTPPGAPPVVAPRAIALARLSLLQLAVRTRENEASVPVEDRWLWAALRNDAFDQVPRQGVAPDPAHWPALVDKLLRGVFSADVARALLAWPGSAPALLARVHAHELSVFPVFMTFARGGTLWTQVVQTSTPGMLQAWLEAGADPNATDQLGRPVLAWCRSNACRAVLLAAGADPLGRAATPAQRQAAWEALLPGLGSECKTWEGEAVSPPTGTGTLPAAVRPQPKAGVLADYLRTHFARLDPEERATLQRAAQAEWWGHLGITPPSQWRFQVSSMSLGWAAVGLDPLPDPCQDAAFVYALSLQRLNQDPERPALRPLPENARLAMDGALPRPTQWARVLAAELAALPTLNAREQAWQDALLQRPEAAAALLRDLCARPDWLSWSSANPAVLMLYTAVCLIPEHFAASDFEPLLYTVWSHSRVAQEVARDSARALWLEPVLDWWLRQTPHVGNALATTTWACLAFEAVEDLDQAKQAQFWARVSQDLLSREALQAWAAQQPALRQEAVDRWLRQPPIQALYAQARLAQILPVSDTRQRARL